MKKRILYLLALTISTPVFSHGYIINSRAKLCAQGVNQNCGSVRWEPQSVEGSDRFPSTGPADGTIAAAGSPRWGKLNEQSPSRWHKINMQVGANTFKWHFSATHRTRDFRYFITKQNWDRTQPLTRASFELTPFCSYSGNGQHPAKNLSHNCKVPNRKGYQIILGVWDVGDTASSFYNVIDVKMSGGGTLPSMDEQKDVGDINPSINLKVNDVVRLRLFTLNGELTDQAVEATITSKEQGKKNTWPKLLAEYINTLNIGLKAGNKDIQGSIVPVFGKNDVFADASSEITRIEIEIDLAKVDVSLDTYLQQSEFYTGEPMQLELDANADPAMKITTELFYQGAKIGYQETPVSKSTQLFLDVNDPQAGTYQLIVKGETKNQQHSVQKNYTITVTDDQKDPVNTVDSVTDNHKDPVNTVDSVTDNHKDPVNTVDSVTDDHKDPVNTVDSVYPDNIGNYSTGDLVHSQDGNIYECLVSGWCNTSRTYYAPGVGLAWNQAWKFVEKGVAPVTEASYTYPKGRGNYQQGAIVKGYNNKLYRCKIPGWCNNPSDFYYAPGIGQAWDSAWTAL